MLPSASLSTAVLCFTAADNAKQKIVKHYNDVIMSEIASHITSLTIVYSIVHSDADQRKHQSSASLALCGEFTGDWWIPRTNGQLRGKCFHLITSSWVLLTYSFIFAIITNSMHHGTCATHLPWCMLWSLARAGGENIPGIPGACAIHNFAYLARGPCWD